MARPTALEDVYRIEIPKDTASPPTPNPPPPRPIGGGSVRNIPDVRPPVVGKTAVPKSAARAGYQRPRRLGGR